MTGFFMPGFFVIKKLIEIGDFNLENTMLNVKNYVSKNS